LLLSSVDDQMDYAMPHIGEFLLPLRASRQFTGESC
jgi:hypothetical protein